MLFFSKYSFVRAKQSFGQRLKLSFIITKSHFIVGPQIINETCHSMLINYLAPHILHSNSFRNSFSLEHFFFIFLQTPNTILC